MAATLCSICGLHFKELTKHLKYKHERNSLPHQCDPCEKSFPTKRDLSFHNQVHHKGRSPCHICSKIFASEKHVKAHIKEV